MSCSSRALVMSALYAGSPGQRTFRDGPVGGGQARRVRQASAEGKTRRSALLQPEAVGVARAAADAAALEEPHWEPPC